MKKYIYIFLVIPMIVTSADNEIYVDQSGATANIDLEQLGSGNIIGGATAIAGTMTPLRFRWHLIDARHQSNRQQQ
jgi:hypothetical protein